VNLVTDIDRRSEEAVIGFLEAEFPDHGILAEECQEVAGRSDYRWILDPLDGTTNYAHGYPCFSISLALEHHAEIVWGAVYDPLREEMFIAELQGGAFLNEKPIRVSSTEALGRALLGTGFPYDIHESADNNIRNFANFANVVQAIRRDGSAALDLCSVACGRFDGYWEMKLSPWDIAAGGLMVTEAGGTVTAFNGAPLDITTGEILASNTLIHNEMMEVLAQARQNTP
jgi:myo-inositol-1(or 4)-monophosphatase